MALSERVRLTEALVLARTRAADLESVRKLNCWASHIGDASIVRRMPNLEVCSLSVNDITTLEDFAHCPNLQELYIRKNRVTDLADITYLKKLERLRVLWLSDNPCSQGDDYRMTVLRTLPNLQKLDNIAVTEEEINRALEEGDDFSGGDKTDPLSGFLSANTNSNAVPFSSFSEDAAADKTTTTAKTTPPNNYSTLVDTSSDNADDKEEAEDSGVEVSAIHLHPEPSEHEPQKAMGLSDAHRNRLQQQEESMKLSLEETNHIRSQLGLKPLPMSKVSPHKSITTGVTKARNANILQSVLLLIRELDKDSLEIVHGTVQQRLENM